MPSSETDPVTDPVPNPVTAPMTANDVRVAGKETPFQGYFKLDVYRLSHRLFAGGWSGEMSREVFERKHAVAVLPYDPILDRVVLIEQFRVGAFAAGQSGWLADGASPWLIEAVAGIIEAGEQIEDVARRETKEETGLAVTALEPICHCLTSPGGSSETIFLYCGRVDAANAKGIHGLADEHEDIRVLTFDAADAVRLPAEGRVVNAVGIIALQWLAAHRDRLRDEWGAGV